MYWEIAIIAARIEYAQMGIEACVEMLIPLSEEEREEQEAFGLPTEEPDGDEIANDLFFFEDEIESQCEDLLYLAIEV